jgi:hypothetical protein
MWPIVGLPAGSLCFENQPKMLDQHIAAKNMATGDAPIKINAATVQVFKCRP